MLLAFSPILKQLDLEAGHSPPSSAEWKNSWLLAVILWIRVKDASFST
jgi:hypothetical protein